VKLVSYIFNLLLTVDHNLQIVNPTVELMKRRNKLKLEWVNGASGKRLKISTQLD